MNTKKQSPSGVQTMLERNAALLGMTVEEMKSTRATHQVGARCEVTRRQLPHFRKARFYSI